MTDELTTPGRTDCPETSTNTLKDIIDWLKLGDAVVLHADDAGQQFYFSGEATTSATTTTTTSLDCKNMRIILVDVSFMPSLLHEAEWSWYIHSATEAVARPEEDEVRKNILKDCPHVYYFSRI